MAELISTEEVKATMESLKKINEIRKDISLRLGSISVKYQLREKVLANLYGYYELVADDYYSLVDRIVRVPEAIELMKEGLTEQRDKLKTEMDRLQEVLEKPLTPKDMKPLMKKIDNHIIYQMRRHLIESEEDEINE